MYSGPYIEVNVSDQETALYAYIEAASARLAALEPSGLGSWRALVEKALGDAYSRADLSGLSRVVQLLVNLLEAEGRFEDAVSEIDTALVVARPEAGATAPLIALKASVLMARGLVVPALALAAEASERADRHLSGTPRIKALVLCETVRLQGLEPPTAQLETILAETVSDKGTLDQLFVLSWLIPYCAALGERERALPLIRTMRALSASRHAALREADVVVFERWATVAHGGPVQHDDLTPPLNANVLAAWRVAALALGAAVIRRERAFTDEGLRRLVRSKLSLRAETGALDNWPALTSAETGTWPIGAVAPKPPSTVTLSSLASALVGGAAVAMAGTAEAAAEWLQWTSRLRRQGIRSCLEFPISVQRLEGLLAIRAGKPAVGRRQLESSREWAAGAGYLVEEAVAHLQSLELQGKLVRGRSCRKGAAEHHLEAEARLTTLGLDPVPYLFTVHKAWDAAGSMPRANILTTRETQVLAELARGASYKQTAETLGIAWPTVQTVAHRVYGKLGVSNRVQAADEARRLALL